MGGNRQSIRLTGYDYTSDGFYLFTCVTRDRKRWFGDVINGEVVLSPAGRIVQEEWERTADVRRRVTLDRFVVMPDHVHGILMIGEPELPMSGSPWPILDIEWTSRFGNSSNTLGSVIGGFKAACSRRIRQESVSEFAWIRNYWERIIRSYEELNAYRNYISNNPADHDQNGLDWLDGLR